MDNFKEEVVTRRQGKVVTTIGYIFCWILIVAFGLYGMIGLSGILAMEFNVQNFVMLIVGGGAAFLLYRYKDNFRTEFEYTFTNGDLDIAKVLGNVRRKQLISLRIREIESGGWADTEAFDRYDSMREVKRLDYYLNGKSRLYYLFFIRDGKKQLLLMEPSEDLVNMMAQYSKALGK